MLRRRPPPSAETPDTAAAPPSDGLAPPPEHVPPAAPTAVRWTEHGPEPVAVAAATPAEPGDVPATPAEPPEPGAPDDLDTIRARLAARGLVRTEPSVRIRDIAGGRPAPPPSAPAPLADPFLPAAPDDGGIGDDAEALEPEPYGPTALVRCPSCRTTQQVAIDATGYRCGNCDKAWRWAICTSCHHLALTIARQESWRCGECGAYSRSWWRTATAPREAEEVMRRKRADAADRERQRVLAVARRRRWKLIAAGVVVVLLAGAAALIFSATDASSPEEQTRATCANWSRLKSDIANGALSGAALQDALVNQANEAGIAASDVQLAAANLTKAGKPGDATFLVASTQLSDACDKATRPGG